MLNSRMALQRRLLDPEFLQRTVKQALLAFMVSLCLNILLALALVVEVSHTPHMRYIYHDSLGKPRELIVTDQPYFSDSEITNWAVAKVTNLYTMNYVDYAKHLAVAAADFDIPAWNAWGQAFKGPGNIEFIKEKRVFLTASPKSAATIRAEGKNERGEYEWHVHFPMLLRWENSSGSTTNLLSIDVSIRRTNAPEHPDGLVITELNAPRASDNGG
ncbi:DotI/IcmL/TraM family protein [Gluconacetobacter sp. 1c LMG 22058]|uniref:DotI/IcmL/TraM family protein n=2 Tax=Gluconacetobacter dulcium TaxID=2729096 RepID=A0A7W4K339_9PROT|nr:DotI/IcmL/TraM family protein [Gluconacetobacter dulcium]